MNLYRHSVTINQKTNAQSASGTYNPTYSERISGLECLLQHKNIQTVSENGRLSYRSVVKLYCDYDSDTAAITEKDRVVVADSGNNAPFAGTYEINGIVDAGGQMHHLEIILEVVD